MTTWEKTKQSIKYFCRKYFNFDPSLRHVGISDDFRDQRHLFPHKSRITIFDVGANTGQTSQKYRKLFPQAEIYAFEPFPAVYNQYVMTFRGDKKIHPSETALSDTTGSSSLFVNNNHYTNSLLPINKDSAVMTTYSTLKQQGIQTDTIDNFCKKNNLLHIHILKIDVQGAELLVLKGAATMLQKQSIDLIYSEIAFTRLYTHQPLFEDIKSHLASYGYVLYMTYNVEKDGQNNPTTGDALFISPQFNPHVS